MNEIIATISAVICLMMWLKLHATRKQLQATTWELNTIKQSIWSKYQSKIDNSGNIRENAILKEYQ